MRRTALLFLVLLLSVAALGEEVITNSIGMRLMPVQPGSFVMGQDGPAADHRMIKHPEKFDDADFDEKPAHRVVITQPFHIGATEVTLGQFRASNPDFRKDTGHDEDAVTSITWHQAMKFCEWLSQKEGRTYRLPTEAEWEYACRAGTTTLFNTGDALPDGYQPWSGDLGYAQRYFTGAAFPKAYRKEPKASLQVAQTAPNAWGLHDMHGNVAEWCLDWYGSYVPGEQTDPLGRATGDFRVIRGGSHSSFVRLLRSANRAAWLPDTRNNKTGFRVVLAPFPGGKPLSPLVAPLHAQDVKAAVVAPAPVPADMPLFRGPQPYVKVPEEAVGPMYFTHNHSPSITECPNGDLLAVWYSCADEGGSELCVLASRLRQGSKTWEQASPFWDGPDVNDHAPKVWWDGEKTLHFFVRGRDETVHRFSVDNGATWSPAQTLQPVGEFGNQVLRLKDGTLVLGHDSRTCSLVFSKDGGSTWQHNALDSKFSAFGPGKTGPRYPGIHAPMVELADGRILALSRNDPLEDQETFGFKTAASFTRDLGKTWTYAASEFPAISSVQRAALIRLNEGPLLMCTFTDQWRDWKNRKGLSFKAEGGGVFIGHGMFAALSFDEGKTWPVRRLLTPGGPDRRINTIDRVMFTLGETDAEPCGYLACTQTRDGVIQLITSKNHYAFNLAWLKQLPPPVASQGR